MSSETQKVSLHERAFYGFGDLASCLFWMTIPPDGGKWAGLQYCAESDRRPLRPRSRRGRLAAR